MAIGCSVILVIEIGPVGYLIDFGDKGGGILILRCQGTGGRSGGGLRWTLFFGQDCVKLSYGITGLGGDWFRSSRAAAQGLCTVF